MVLLPLFGVCNDIRVWIAATQMRRGFHMGMVNAILPLRKAGRNHLLSTYVITGFVASLAYAVS